MFKSKNQFKIIYLYLICFIGILFIFNNHQVMAMNNQNNILNEEYLIHNEITIKNKINQLFSQSKNLSNKISHCNKLDLNTMNLKKQLKVLDVQILNLYKQLGIYNILNDINKKIWDLSHKRQQLIIKINSSNKEQLDIENYEKIIIKIIKLQDQYKKLIPELNIKL
ncbi:SVM family protein ['Fragaria x ananassa' phyllody phytoplasma]|uniref:SVM family protein n=1 Tax='Fragaria x ananassa' phyllody phytoplasma TaxID=2358428 RepID=A0ABS5K3X7_9MOLU|nr:SVM family protein ['Fragaria x ananassa' phyllody phytoplasma]MBS2126603.1 SVM family protein ['Fragaria x ananassa' phyllody phytoplasma]